jgi:hypothetical protein
MLPSTVSISHYTFSWFCVTLSTDFFYCLSTTCHFFSKCKFSWFYITVSTVHFYNLCTVCQHVTQYCLSVPCHYVQCFLLHSDHCLTVPHTVLPLGTVPLCPMPSFTVSPLSVNTSHGTVCWFCATMFTVSSTVCPLSVSNFYCTFSWFCGTLSNAVFYSLYTIYLTIYRLLVLCHSVHCFLLKSVYRMTVPHTARSLGSVSLCTVLSSTLCPLSVSISHCTVC